MTELFETMSHLNVQLRDRQPYEVQPYTIGEVARLANRDDEWTRIRVERLIEAGIPETGRLWLEVIADRTFGIDTDEGSITVTVRRFEWRVTWTWGPNHHPMNATGRGDTEPEAFEALMKALA